MVCSWDNRTQKIKSRSKNYGTPGVWKERAKDRDSQIRRNRKYKEEMQEFFSGA